MSLVRPAQGPWLKHNIAVTKLNKTHSIRRLTVTRTLRTNMAPVFASPQSSHEKLGTDLKPLLKEYGGGWVLSSDGMALERGWEFGGFNKAWAFMNAVAEEAKSAKHHPEWANTYNRVIVRWTTHRDHETKQSGLSDLDLQLAAACGNLAAEYGAKKDLAIAPNGADFGADDLKGMQAAIKKLDGCDACRS